MEDDSNSRRCRTVSTVISPEEWLGWYVRNHSGLFFPQSELEVRRPLARRTPDLPLGTD